MRQKKWAGALSWCGYFAASAALAVGAESAAQLPALPAPTASTAQAPPVLNPPAQPNPSEGFTPAEPSVLTVPTYPPLGFTGRSRVGPVEAGSEDYTPMPDRWRSGFPDWDRYQKDHPLMSEYPFVYGSLIDPYHQNVLKGDYAIFGQNTFLNITGTSFTVINEGQAPTNATGLESTARPFQSDFFGSPNSLQTLEYLSLSFDLFHGDAAFKPVDWRIKVTPVFNINTLNVDELGVVSPNTTKGTQRDRTFFSLEEYFVEVKLADISPEFDFVSARVGNQFFNNDFRGFLFIDTNDAVRVFGTNFANRDQFNVAYFRQWEKDTNSGLNTFDDRGQNIVVANYFHQDFIVPGNTVEASVLYNHDPASITYDRNGFLVRPDAVGTFTPQREDIFYLGLGSDGHVDRFNLTTQVYWALGQEGHNNLSGQQVDVNAWMAAAELSYDRDWTRFRTSFFFSSGDKDIFNSHATGFDAVLSDPNFAGGEFSYWQRQEIRLFGVALKPADSLIPSLRSSNIEGQSNFVNPGLILFNLGVDFEVTPKLKLVNNCNFLWFDSTDVLKQFTFDGHLDTTIGEDLSTGVEYRPFLNNNVVMEVGVATLIPGSGFKALYDFAGHSVNPLIGAFAELKLTF